MTNFSDINIKIKRQQSGAILLISLIMVSVVAGIGVSFGSIANVHKKIVTAQAKNLDSKIKAISLRNIINNKVRQNIDNPTNPCSGIPNCSFLNKDTGSVTDLRKGIRDVSWWKQNANQSTYSIASTSATANAGAGNAGVLRYVIRLVSTPKDGSQIYEIVAFAADADGKYQNVSRQYRTIIDPNASKPPPPAPPPPPPPPPSWPAGSYGTPNERVFNTLTPGELTVDSGGNITQIRGPDGTSWQVNGNIKLEQNSFFGKPGMARYPGAGNNSSSGTYNNNAGSSTGVMVTTDYVALAVAKVATWGQPTGCCYCDSQLTIMEFGYYSSIRAFINGCNPAHMFGFSGGHGTAGSWINISASTVFDNNIDTEPVVLAYRRQNNTQFTAYAANRRGHIVTGSASGTGANLGPAQLSIGPLQDFSENSLGSPKLIIGETRYIDKAFSDSDVTTLFNATFDKWGFPW